MIIGDFNEYFGDFRVSGFGFGFSDFREPHDFLCIDFSQERNEQIEMGWSKVLSIGK
jgi:hypothetical protein